MVSGNCLLRPNLFHAPLLFCLLFSISVAFGFDISVYNDAISDYNGGWWKKDGDTTHTYEQSLSRVTNNPQVLQWWENMGVDVLAVYYPYESNWTNIDAMNTNMKVMNMAWPGYGYRYVDANYRRITLGDLGEDWDYVNTVNWGSATTLTTMDIGGGHGVQPVLAIGPGSGTPADMWLPHTEKNLGEWWGWDRQQGLLDRMYMRRQLGISNDDLLPDSLRYMPIHFRLVCDFVPDSAHLADSVVATFNWMFHTQSWEYEKVGWIQYPARPITLGDFTDPQEFDTIEWVFNPASWDIRDTLSHLNDDFTWHERAYLRHSIHERVSANMRINWTGYHQFFVYRVEVWDEGFPRRHVHHMPRSEEPLA